MIKSLAVAAFAPLAFAMLAPGASAQTTVAVAGAPAASGAQAIQAIGALTLINGWTNAPFGTSVAQIETLSNVVRFKGAIATAGANPVPFILPPAFRPTVEVYVPVDLCNATNGRLFIQPSGVVTVQAETSFSNAQCFTSLDGASFVLNATLVTPLFLVNGWGNAPFGTANAAIRNISGIVQFKGAIHTASANPVPFVLPPSFRPVTNVYVPVDLCNATNGRLFIQPSGVVTVQAETSFSNAQCFTSLDGASFAPNSGGVTPLTLLNGWVNAPFSTAIAAFRNISGVVHFKGAIGTTKPNPVPFILPATVRPAKNVYVQVDLCNATNGRLFIQPNGVVTVQAEKSFSNAQCFTSLEGTSFVR
jgi:hypothetical protein